MPHRKENITKSILFLFYKEHQVALNLEKGMPFKTLFCFYTKCSPLAQSPRYLPADYRELKSVSSLWSRPSPVPSQMGHIEVPVLECDSAELIDRKPLAKGTTSIVERATLHTLPVAVKTLRPPEQIAEASTRERAAADFQNEFEINVALRHPNIVLLIGCVRVSTVSSLIFELCDGGTLRCKDYGLHRLLDGLSVCTAVGRALCFAHRLSIMHRDIKPSQVVFANGVPKLADWGLAKSFDSNGHFSGETGTWEFVSYCSS